MADASRVQLLIATETNFAESPVSTAMNKLRLTKESLKHRNETAVSEEIRSDRSRSDLILVGTGTEGNVEGEFSALSFDMLIEAALCGIWSTTSDGNFSDGVGNGSTTFTSATAAFVSGDVGKFLENRLSTTNIPANTYIVSVTNGTTVVLSNSVTTGSSLNFAIKRRTSSATFADGVANGTTLFTSAGAAFTSSDIGKVINSALIPANTYIAAVVSGTNITLSQAATGSGGSQSFTIVARTGNLLTNSTINRSFLIERGHLDIGQYFQFAGQTLNTWQFSLSSKKIITNVFGFMGAYATRATSSVSSSINSGWTTAPMSSGPFVVGFAANTNMTGIKTRAITLNVDNNLRSHDLADSLTTDDFGRGPMDITGTLELYFKTVAIYDQFIANGAIDFSFQIGDGFNTYRFRLPKFKIADEDLPTPGVEQDIIQTINFRALFDPTLACMMRITRS